MPLAARPIQHDQAREDFHVENPPR
jgi:hypothetical protein